MTSSFDITIRHEKGYDFDLGWQLGKEVVSPIKLRDGIHTFKGRGYVSHILQKELDYGSPKNIYDFIVTITHQFEPNE